MAFAYASRAPFVLPVRLDVVVRCRKTGRRDVTRALRCSCLQKTDDSGLAVHQVHVCTQQPLFVGVDRCRWRVEERLQRVIQEFVRCLRHVHVGLRVFVVVSLTSN